MFEMLDCQMGLALPMRPQSETIDSRKVYEEYILNKYDLLMRDVAAFHALGISRDIAALYEYNVAEVYNIIVNNRLTDY